MTRRDPDDQSERRRYPRVSLIEEIECTGEKGTFRKRPTDISVGGMFVDGLTRYRVGEVVTLRFGLPDKMDPVEVRAKVVYVHKKVGAGLEFLDLSQQDRKRIGEMVHKFMAVKKPADAELRLATRVQVRVPIILHGTDDAPFEERTHILVVSKNGASIRTRRKLPTGTKVIINIPGGASHEARVVWTGVHEVGVQCPSLARALGFDFP